MTPAPPAPNPLLIDIPTELNGPRLCVRRYRDGDGPIVAAAVAESRERLVAAGMPWVKEWADPNQPTIFVRRAQAQWAARESFLLGLWDRAGGGFVGSSGLHRIDWSVPNAEIGYWLRNGYEGKGLMTEAVAMIAALAFDTLQAQRVRIRCDARNARSAALPRRLGFIHEGTFRNETRNGDGSLGDTFEFGMTPDEFRAKRDGPWRTFFAS